MGDSGAIHVINYPGFHDHRADVNQATDDYLAHTDMFLLVIDVSRGVSETDIANYHKVQKLGRPTLVCANKLDLVRPKERSSVVNALVERLQLEPRSYVCCSFDPDERLGEPVSGVAETREWILDRCREHDKDVTPLEDLWGRSS